jgi:hypothetical protein
VGTVLGIKVLWPINARLETSHGSYENQVNVRWTLHPSGSSETTAEISINTGNLINSVEWTVDKRLRRGETNSFISVPLKRGEHPVGIVIQSTDLDDKPFIFKAEFKIVVDK